VEAVQVTDDAPKKKRKKPVSATAKSLHECKRRGWIAQTVEQTIPHTFIKRDLFGVIDIIAVQPPSQRIGDICCVYKRPYIGASEPGSYTCPTCGVTNDMKLGAIIGIQACAGASHAARRDKILAEPRMLQWLKAGGQLQLWSWSKRGQRDARKLWTLRTEDFRVEQFECATSEPVEAGEVVG
jgi:hypothetical protein